MAYPNAGLPNELGEYDELPEQTGGPARGMGGDRLRQHHRRLLRLHARAYRGNGDGGGGLSAAPDAGAARGTRLAGLEPITLAA